jgi:hypothetical protein
MRDEVTGVWRNFMICILSPTILPVIKSRKIRWVGNVARLGMEKACTGFWYGNLTESDHWGDPSIAGRIILR